MKEYFIPIRIGFSKYYRGRRLASISSSSARVRSLNTEINYCFYIKTEKKSEIERKRGKDRERESDRVGSQVSKFRDRLGRVSRKREREKKREGETKREWEKEREKSSEKERVSGRKRRT